MVIYNYNHTEHRTIKNKPDNILHKGLDNKQTVIIVPNNFKVNDNVRLKLK